MNNSEINLLLEIIDKRVRKILKEEHICYRYIAKVQDEYTENGGTITVTSSFTPNTSTPVTMLGFENTNNVIYHFPNRTSVTLNKGDLVYIDAMGNNLNSGAIVNIYKYENELYIN